MTSLFIKGWFIRQMSQKEDAAFPSKYLHHEDMRTEKEKLLSDKIVRSLSELNLQRIRMKQADPEAFQYSQKYFFVCLTGIPPFLAQFENLQLPGQRVNYSISGFAGSYTPEQYMKIAHSISIESEAKNVAEIIDKVPRDRKIIIVFHSFGSFVVSAYSHLYDQSRIFGLIDIGGIPITMYKVLKNILKSFTFQFSFLIQNVDLIYKQYVQYAKAEKFVPLQNKYQMLIFMKIVEGKAFQTIFEWARNYPNVLKLFVEGRRDVFFSQSLLCEKMVYYSYLKKLDTSYETSLNRAYSRFYGSEVKNVQQRFLLSFEQGKHSLHCQPKLVHDIKIAIRQYLKVLDLASQADS